MNGERVRSYYAFLSQKDDVTKPKLQKRQYELSPRRILRPNQRQNDIYFSWLKIRITLSKRIPKINKENYCGT